VDVDIAQGARSDILRICLQRMEAKVDSFSALSILIAALTGTGPLIYLWLRIRDRQAEAA